MSEEIKCPHCGKVFKIDEQNYESILKQVKDKKFEEELNERIKAEVQITKANSEREYLEKLHKQQEEYNKFQNLLTSNHSLN